MAYDNSNGQSDDPYSDGEPDLEKPAAPETETAEDSEQPTATLPKEILMGKTFKVGDEVVLKITGIHEKDISVTYAPPKKEAPGADASEGETDPEMESLMS